MGAGLRRSLARRSLLTSHRPHLSHRAILTARRDAGAGLHLVTLTPPAELAPQYRAAGQYVEARLSGEGGYFVFASDVGAPAWELLVRDVGGASTELACAPEGTTFDVSTPLGSGFPSERACGRDLILVVAGSALAAARPVLRERIARGEAGATSLYLGARTPADVPLDIEVAGWAAAGVNVVLCLSQGPRAGDAMTDPGVLGAARRAAGWAQHVLERDLRARTLPGSLVFAAGPEGMLAELTALARPESLDLEVLTNV